jgi:hypothetical protein
MNNNLFTTQLLTCESNKCKKYKIDTIYDILDYDTNLNNDIILNNNTNLNNDILLNKESKINKEAKINKEFKINKSKKKKISFVDYIILLFLFILLNNKTLIDYIKSKHLTYLFSSFIRGMLFIFLYYIIKKLI